MISFVSFPNLREASFGEMPSLPCLIAQSQGLLLRALAHLASGQGAELAATVEHIEYALALPDRAGQGS